MLRNTSDGDNTIGLYTETDSEFVMPASNFGFKKIKQELVFAVSAK